MIAVNTVDGTLIILIGRVPVVTTVLLSMLFGATLKGSIIDGQHDMNCCF